MKKYAMMILGLTALTGAAQAQDASQQKQVPPAAVQVAPPVTPGVQAPAAVVSPPAEEKRWPRDAITGDVIKDENNPLMPKPEEPSLRDQIRSKMENK